MYVAHYAVVLMSFELFFVDLICQVNRKVKKSFPEDRGDADEKEHIMKEIDYHGDYYDEDNDEIGDVMKELLGEIDNWQPRLAVPEW